MDVLPVYEVDAVNCRLPGFESEPRIAVKIIHGHFVTCYPMPENHPDTFPQHLRSPRYFYRSFDDCDWGLSEQIRTKADQQA